MSDSQKHQRLPTTPIKNPLLSASITGLSFDDFPNKPLLLPAAPPIAHASVTSPVITNSGFVAKEPKSLVTVGSSSLDTENLDEINLNVSNEDNQTSYVTDPNSNPSLDQTNQGINSDSILSQAASSFSALPSVASNVFSTFSKRITSISSRETTPVYDHYQSDSNANVLDLQSHTQTTSIQQSDQGDFVQTSPTFFYAPVLGGNYISSTSATSDQKDTQTNLPSLEPPKLYTPADVPPVPSAGPPTTNLSGKNNFRFSSKKKLYAPIPGLSDQSLKPTTTFDPSTVSAPIAYDTLYEGTQSSHYSTCEDQKLEEHKLGSGLFSKITNLAPAGVLQNITGLVQSAAETLTQTNKTDYSQQDTSPLFNQQNISFATPPPPTNYFVPPSIGGPQIKTDLPTTIAEHNSTLNTQTSAIFSSHQSEATNFFILQSNTQGFNETFLQPLKNIKHSPAATTTTSQAQIPLFVPTNLPTQINPSSSFHPNPAPLNSGSAQLTTNEQTNPKLFNLNQSNPSESAFNNSTPVSFFDPTRYLPQSSQTNITGQSSLSPHSLPPLASGHTSYRLQKGTKLYKNPLTPQETAPIQVTPEQILATNQSLNTYPSQQSFTTPQSVPLFVSPPVTEPNIIQSVPPVTAAPESLASPLGQNIAEVEIFKSNETIQSVPVLRPLGAESPQSIPLFAPAIKDIKSNEALQSIPLFDASYSSTQSNSLLTPQVEELKTEKQIPISFAPPPIKKLKSDDSVEDALVKNNNLNELNTNELEQSAALEIKRPLVSLDNTFEIHVPKQDTKLDRVDNKETQSILEPIEPVLEENIIETQKVTTEDPLEETLQKLSLTESSSQSTNPKLPSITESFKINNLYCKDSVTDTAKPAPSLPTLANFFTPEPSNGSADLNFFASLPVTQSSSTGINFFSESIQDKEVNQNQSTPFAPELTPLEPSTTIHPPISAFFPTLPTSLGLVSAILEDKNDITKHLNESFAHENVPLPIEPTAPVLPDNTTVQPETTIQTRQPEVVNRFSNFFKQTNSQPKEIAKDSLTFFDSLNGKQLGQTQQQQQLEQQLEQQQPEITIPSVVTNEEQRIQYFFNNPPPKDASAVGDLNYDLVHSGLGIKNLQQRSLTPISNLVEPPSSGCSEFSEVSNPIAGQKSIPANLSITDSSEKVINKEATNTSTNKVYDSTKTVNSNNKHYEELPEEIIKELQMANLLSADKLATTPVASVSYQPPIKHWFYKRPVGDKHIWIPFSHYDSALLETSLLMEGNDKTNIVAVEGGRYDVNISERKKMSVYWESQPIEVRRCSWFYKAVDSHYVPYEEQTAELLEREYKRAAESRTWHKTIVLGVGDQVVFHGPMIIVHFQQHHNSDAWGGTAQTTTRPRVVKRGLSDFNIEQGESQKVDHLLFMVHGIGSACDLKLRSVEEVVDDFRTIAHQLVQSHYKNSTDLGLVGRVEVLPISWHSHLHSVEVGIDEKLRMITLESIPKLRNFTNDTLLDILFYTSPTFCQKIVNTITSSINTLYLKYRERHPDFNGGVSLAGHSLGSLILFDLLCHQNPIKESEEKNQENPDQFLVSTLNNTQIDSNQLEDKQISYTMGPAGTGQPFINYGQLIFQPKKFFALGSPIGMFVTIRGIDKLGLDFRLPTCPGFYNIFHPYDPVAYRIEALVNPDLSGVRPVLIPHHKGRKRMHLELKETMTRVSTDLKNRFLDKLKTALDGVNIFGSTTKSTEEAEEFMEKEVDKVIQMQIELEQQNDNIPSTSDNQSEIIATTRQRTYSGSTVMSDDMVDLGFPLGKLNDSKRIDYVLQEAPLEFINEYIFALSSHVCYWDSEDTILFVMKEIYSGLGISPDSQVPQQTLTIERPSARNSPHPFS